MVVVIVRDQHRVDRRQIVEGDGRLVRPPRPGEAERADPLRPDRIDQEVEATDLEEDAGMPGRADAQIGDPLRRLVARQDRRSRRPFLPLLADQHADELEARLRRRLARRVESQTVEMIRDVALMITVPPWHLR
jgi:hypothetical protein